jgi:hypothetical protein
MGSVVRTTFTQSQSIDCSSLSGNNISGTIPPSINNLTELRTLSLFTNKLSGTVPDIRKLTLLQSLSFCCNDLTGEIPDLSSFHQLSVVTFSENRFSGQIPELANLKKLSFVRFEKNQLYGMVPDVMLAQQNASCIFQVEYDTNCLDCSKVPAECRCIVSPCVPPSPQPTLSTTSSTTTSLPAMPTNGTTNSNSNTTIMPTTHGTTISNSNSNTMSNTNITITPKPDVVTTAAVTLDVSESVSEGRGGQGPGGQTPFIIGGVVGGIIALICIVGIIVMIMRQRSRSDNQSAQTAAGANHSQQQPDKIYDVLSTSEVKQMMHDQYDDVSSVRPGQT